MRVRLRFATLIVAVVVTMLAAAPVAAASSWQTFSQSGVQAFAAEGPESIQDCTDNPGPTVTCEYRSVDVFKGTEKETGVPSRKVERVCYSQFSDRFNPKTGVGTSVGVFGCAEKAGILTINELESIALAQTEIELTTISCNFSPTTFDCTESPDGTIVVEGTWTGEGPVSTQKSRFSFDDGTCMQADASKGRFRNASFAGGPVGDPMDATFAQLGQGSFSFRSRCTL